MVDDRSPTNGVVAGSKRSQMLAVLRRRILAGELSAGQRLPTRQELVREFDTSLMTVQWATSRLQAEGFIEARGPLGTFVVDHPPHEFEYGVVFSQTAQQMRVGFAHSLHELARSLHWLDGQRLRYFYGVDGRGQHDEPALREAVAQGRLAGLILVQPEQASAEQLAQLASGMPIMAILNRGVLGGASVGAVRFDTGRWLERAAERLQSLGCRRPAVLTPSLEAEDELAGVFEAHGLEYHRWLHLNCRPHPEAIAMLPHLIELVFDRQPQPPDAVMVRDDYLLPHTLSALTRLGWRIGEDVAIVSHANLPLASADPWPIDRLGFDLRQMLHLALELLATSDQHPDGKEVDIPPFFIDEVDEASGSVRSLRSAASAELESIT